MQKFRSLVVIFVFVLTACAPVQPIAPTQPATASPMPLTWLSVELTDASSGETFTINDFKGKVVLVDSMAIWCPNCLRQGLNLKSLRSMYSPDDLVLVTLDIDSHEDASMLADYAKQAGFDWRFAVAPLELQRNVGNVYGALFLDPTLSPTLIVDRSGEVYKMGFGEKKAEAMSKSLAPLIAAGSK